MSHPSVPRRTFLASAALSPLAAAAMGRLGTAWAADDTPLRVHDWRRDERNPILPPQQAFDRRRAMNPFVLRQDDHYWLFYGGADAQGRHRICLAIAKVGELTAWKRLGPLFDNGPAGAFDELWCVLPCVHRIGDRWHLYYTGRGRQGAGLQSFRGIGLAVSVDLRNWQRLQPQPVLAGDGFPQWPDNQGIAGGGRIVELPQPDGRTLYRMHYTLATGRPSEDLRVDQAKRSVVAHSWDGISWFDKQVVLEPRPDATYEDSATIALNVWKSGQLWRAIYAGIGTKFGGYSICEAESDDGLVWRRGRPGENLALPPSGNGWESNMTTYPNVIAENGLLRLFYCGNGYGATGIGSALAEPVV